ncbi:DUF4047 domain-containing protein [Heyndrickxia sp. NPDC080065]|uniref:DUF4047 domain-containing protein n=1 Tax=Heyndrickxia sp. NPDC080065 TaxID=3390568 RepID=UPI003D02B41C
MSRKYHKVVFPCLCCLSFYLGTQIIGETEASFSSQTSLEKITITTAFVFPSTIKDLKNRAKKTVKQIQQSFERIDLTSKNLSIKEIKEKLARISQTKGQIEEFYKIYDELSRYYQQVQKQKDGNHTFNYVSDGFKNVDMLKRDKKLSSYSRRIEAISVSLREQIEKLEKQETQVPQKKRKPQDSQEEKKNQETPILQDDEQGVKKSEESDSPGK